MAEIKCQKLFWTLLKEPWKISPHYDSSKGFPYDETAVLELAKALCPDIVSWRTEDDLETLLNDAKPIFKALVGDDGISATIDEIMEITERYPEHLPMIKSLTSQAFEISQTIKRE